MITSLFAVFQFGSLDLLTPTQVAELTLSSGALNNTDQINAVFDRLEDGHAFQNVDEFLTTLAAAPEASRWILKMPGRAEATQASPTYLV